MFPLFKKIEENPLHLLFLQNQVQKNDYVFHHAVTVGLLSGYIAKRMKLSRGDYYQVLLAGTMADCGMAKVDPKVFQKEQLTSAEREDIQLHPQYSFKLVQNIPSLNQGAKIAILQHHERLDGSGYPSGAKGDSIHLYSRIIAISDVYHAIVCDRVYRNRVSPFEALEIMNRDMFGKLDISILETFTNYLCQQALNMYVKLSNGMVVKIIYIDKRYPTRPVVKEAESGEILRLDQRQDLTIEEIIREG
jgi:HD domain.